MFVESLKLWQFRNLNDSNLAFSAGVNYLVGDNGQGKTNLTEALGLLSSAKSFRTSDLKELVKWGETSASVFGSVNQKLGITELGIQIVDGSKRGLVNGKQVENFTEYIGRLPSVIFSPSDLYLIKGAPQLRRRFIDRHISDIDQRCLASMFDYNRALKHKNNLLRQGINDARQLEPWNEIMATSGVDILKARQDFIAALESKSREYYSIFALEEGMSLSLSLKTNVRKDKTEAFSLEAYREQLGRNRAREAQFRSSLVGPHRDDVLIEFNEKEARSFASQGQTRSLVLALKLAVLDVLAERTKDEPILFLDDVDSELDDHRRRALFRILESREHQIFVTGTQAPGKQYMGNVVAKVFHVSQGKIVENN